MNNNVAEIEKFAKLAKDWWNPKGSLKSLHQINPLRLEYIDRIITENISKEFSELKILDIGCGAGLVSIPLAKRGAKVTAIDAAEENINVLSLKAQQENININCQAGLIDCARGDFDVIICLELLEHLDDIESFIHSLYSKLSKNGLVIFSTINRNIKSGVMAIAIAEYLLNYVPKGTHQFDKLIKPSEIDRICRGLNLSLIDLSGMSYDIFRQKFNLSKNLDVNYFASYKNMQWTSCST